jgi:hypothetical protein
MEVVRSSVESLVGQGSGVGCRSLHKSRQIHLELSKQALSASLVTHSKARQHTAYIHSLTNLHMYVLNVT